MLICLAQIVCFFGLMYYFSIELQTDVIYRFMEEFIASRTAWLGCFFIVASLWTIDHMLHSIRLFFASLCGATDEVLDLEEEEAKLGRRKHTLQLTRQYSLRLSMRRSNTNSIKRSVEKQHSLVETSRVRVTED